ncbi:MULTISPECIES: glutaredoxin family protein [unclassified Bacillus (in: firmicutes)]|uniref:glutaredoxin family protein n=1 Tax=unclassified Bacillus (in: firmicutes) TaxID=185979 RepID=UPI000BA8D517|nr:MULTISPECIES: glutaredoxin family protein [unclassified Bacillus (in: firmicutes)]PAQ13615.1 NrdH-redoxin [Bacillaceae bacterium SAOS 7]
MNKVTVYSTNTCPYCTMMKNFLNEQGISYKEVNVQQDQQAAQRLVATTGQMGVPQTEVNGQWVLGYDPQAVMSLLK